MIVNSPFRAGLLVIGYSIVMILIGVSVCMVAHGEQYKPNLTKAEWEEYRLTEMCYAMQEDFTIELLEEFCKESYGDLDSLYGEKLVNVTN